MLNTHDVASIIFILLETIVQPYKFFVLTHNEEIIFGIAGQLGARVHGELNLVLFTQRIRYVHHQTVVGQHGR